MLNKFNNNDIGVNQKTMNLSNKTLKSISQKYGESFYILDTKQFQKNYKELLKAFRDIYPNTHIAYSYKTNYTPHLCKIVDELGGFAEVVSDMEYKIALKVGVLPPKIYFNGPYKDSLAVEELLLNGGTVNIDSNHDFEIIKSIAGKYIGKTISVGIRCNFDIQDGVLSRFGFDVENEEFTKIINTIRKIPNIKLNGLHCHYATRSLDCWPIRVEKMLELVNKFFDEPPLFISLGGGLYGKMSNSLKAQFNENIPSYNDYASVAAKKFRECFSSYDESLLPMLIIEPGSALAGDSMKFVAKVINIKDVRGKKIATLSGSIYNINPTLNKKNLPFKVYHDNNSQNNQVNYDNIDFGGYTCIESDYLYRGYKGKLAEGDYIVFDNVGSYSVVLKPPFILPNFPIIKHNEETKENTEIKRREKLEDLFNTYKFE